MASATSIEVVADPNELKEVLAAGTREEVYIRNMSGAAVLLYVDGSTKPYDQIEAVPDSSARISLTGTEASLAIHARCPTAPLTLWVTPVIA